MLLGFLKPMYTSHLYFNSEDMQRVDGTSKLSFVIEILPMVILQRSVFGPLFHCIMLFLRDLIHSTTSFITSLHLNPNFSTNHTISLEL